MISPIGYDLYPGSQAQQSDELSALVQVYTSDERAIELGV